MKKKKSLLIKRKPSNSKFFEKSEQSKLSFRINRPSKNSISFSDHKPLSLTVDLPVFEEYMHIDLSKTSSYHRIDRSLVRNSIVQTTQIPKVTIQQFKHNKCMSSSFLKDKFYSVSRYQTQSFKEKKDWKGQVNEYIEAKQNCFNKVSSSKEQFPLMKLTRNNQLRRKKLTRQRTQSDKPEIVKSLEKQQLYADKPLSKNKKLSKIIKLKYDKLRPCHSKQLLKQQNKPFFNAMIQNGNQSQKILINFIGNYFKQKFLPSDQYSSVYTHHRNRSQCGKESSYKLKSSKIRQSHHFYKKSHC